LATILLALEGIMVTEIDLVVERLFPDDLVPTDSFEEWCSLIREEVQPAAADLIFQLESCLEEIRPACTTACDPRKGCWERFGGEGDQLIKSITSIRSKLARDLLDEAITAPKLSPEELRKRIMEFGDLGRVRLVGEFPSDVTCLQEKLLTGSRFLGKYKYPKGVKDFIYDRTKRDGLKGHRARQLSVRVPLEVADFGFEIQLMTRLQHAWDRRNHPFYEWQRENPNWERDQSAVELAVNDFACAEALHLVDRQANQNWLDLQKFIRKEHTE
jgi:ppGpp synthetase/RelA/SpoT-type nucleotidyltranferase